jgi:hypothetical protein
MRTRSKRVSFVVVVDIHFVCSFCLFSVTILQYLISLFRCTQTDRQTDIQLVMMMVAMKRKRVGGTETKFYQSLTSSYVTGERFLTNCQQYYTVLIFLALLLSLKCIYLPDCENIVHHSIRHEP